MERIKTKYIANRELELLVHEQDGLIKHQMIQSLSKKLINEDLIDITVDEYMTDKEYSINLNIIKHNELKQITSLLNDLYVNRYDFPQHHKKKIEDLVDIFKK